MMRTAILLLCLVVPACASQQIVKVPVPVKPEVPARLRNWSPSQAPVFVLPDVQQATSCLTPEGEQRLRNLLVGLAIQLCAWEAWGDLKTTKHCEAIKLHEISAKLRELPSP